jgi:hypothetical protein
MLKHDARTLAAVMLVLGSLSALITQLPITVLQQIEKKNRDYAP